MLIDVRDLTEWMIHMVENRHTGVYNVAGPASRLEGAGTLDTSWTRWPESCWRILRGLGAGGHPTPWMPPNRSLASARSPVCACNDGTTTEGQGHDE